MRYELLQWEEKFAGQVGEIRLGPPPANIVSAKIMAEISDCLEEATKNPHCKLVIISGQGKNFSYGASVEEHAPGKVKEMLPSFHKMIAQLLSCPVPTLAKVTGLCLGGGFEVALACNFIFADDTAKFAVPEIQLGVFPPVAAALLPAQYGSVVASKLILTGEKFSGKELAGLGMITQLVETGNLDTMLASFIEKQILPKSASSLRIANFAAKMSVSENYNRLIANLEKLYLGDLMNTKDAVEGIQSFIEKRPPKWTDA
jgi:cyclohexa-1,5-dienecarbonyl-CoA hydratase